MRPWFSSAALPPRLATASSWCSGSFPGLSNILVYDFAASADELPTNSALYGNPDVDTTPQTAEQIAEGKQLGALIATSLVDDIQALGMPAELATADAKPQLNDLVIRGYLVSVKEGSEGKRIVIGFGDGSSDLKTAVEAFQMTATGLRKLGSGDLNAKGAKTPGTALGLAALIATHNPVGLDRQRWNPRLWRSNRQQQGGGPGQADGQGNQ